MALYRVRWEVDIEAPSKREATKHARAMQRNPESTATLFDVRSFHKMKDWRLIDSELDTE